MPVSGLLLTPIQPNSGVVVLPRMIAPARRKRETIALSAAATSPRRRCVPYSICMPRTASWSLIVTGTPCSGPIGSPLASARSAATAASIASSAAR